MPFKRVGPLEPAAPELGAAGFTCPSVAIVIVRAAPVRSTGSQRQRDL